jgi:hypothetical protein
VDVTVLTPRLLNLDASIETGFTPLFLDFGGVFGPSIVWDFPPKLHTGRGGHAVHPVIGDVPDWHERVSLSVCT